MTIKTKYKLSDVCLYVFWFLLQVGKGLGYVSSDIQFTIIIICSLPFAVGRMLMLQWTNREIYKLAVLLVLGILITLRSGTTTYLLSIFCIAAAKEAEIKQLLKVTLFVRGPLFLLRTTLSIMGFLNIEMRYRFDSDGNYTLRYALGYDHPNTAQYELFMLIMLLFILYSERMRIYHYLLAFAYSLFIFRYTDSKTSFFLGGVFLFGAYFFSGKWNAPMAKILTFWSSKSWVVSIFVSCLGCWGYLNIPKFHKLGTFASRFQTAVAIIQNYNLPLLGMRGISTDLGLVYLLFDGGIILTVLFFWGAVKLLKLPKMQNEVLVHWAFVCLAVFNIMEAYTYSVLSNGLLLYLSYVVYEKIDSFRLGKVKYV